MKINPKITFGWSADVWSHAFTISKEVQKILQRKNLKILEIGAGKHSQVAYVFDKTQSNITIGFYSESYRNYLKEVLSKNIKNYNLVSKYELSCIDALDLKDKYDVIILKSVLGGIFRGDDFSKAEKFCHKTVRDNLNSNGALITIDNGKSCFEIFLRYFGARKNNWHFATMDELLTANEKVGFGFLSAFSLSRRFGLAGIILEKLLYYIDLLLSFLTKFKPTVICSVFLKI